MTCPDPELVAWAQQLRRRGLRIAEIAELLHVKAVFVRSWVAGVPLPSTFRAADSNFPLMERVDSRMRRWDAETL